MPIKRKTPNPIRYDDGGSLLRFTQAPIIQPDLPVEAFREAQLHNISNITQLSERSDAIDVGLAQQANTLNIADQYLIEEKRDRIKSELSDISRSGNTNVALARTKSLFSREILGDQTVLRAQQDQKQYLKNQQTLDSMFASGNLDPTLYRLGKEQQYTPISERIDTATGFITPIAPTTVPPRKMDINKEIKDIAFEYLKTHKITTGFEDVNLDDPNLSDDDKRIKLSNYIDTHMEELFDTEGLSEHIKQQISLPSSELGAYIDYFANATDTDAESVIAAHLIGVENIAAGVTIKDFTKFSGNKLRDELGKREDFRRAAIRQAEKDAKIGQPRIGRSVSVAVSNNYSDIFKTLDAADIRSITPISTVGPRGAILTAKQIVDQKSIQKVNNKFANLKPDQQPMVLNVIESNTGLTADQFKSLSVEEQNAKLNEVKQFFNNISDSNYISSYSQVFSQKRAEAETKITFGNRDEVAADGILTGQFKDQKFYDPETGKIYASGTSKDFQKDIVKDLKKGTPLYVSSRLEPINPYKKLTNDKDFTRGYTVQIGNKTLIMSGYPNEVSRKDVDINDIYMSRFTPNITNILVGIIPTEEKDDKGISKTIKIDIPYRYDSTDDLFKALVEYGDGANKFSREYTATTAEELRNSIFKQ